jgi:hypothetical protein
MSKYSKIGHNYKTAHLNFCGKLTDQTLPYEIETMCTAPFYYDCWNGSNYDYIYTCRSFTR